MTIHKILAGLLIAVAALAGSATGLPGTDEETLMALEREWTQRFAGGDVDWIVAAHAPEAQQFPPDAAPVVGQEAIRAAWQGMADAEGLSLVWEPTKAFVSSSGDMAWDYGAGKLTNPGGEAQDVKYVVIWKRVDREWKVVMDMFSPNGG